MYIEAPVSNFVYSSFSFFGSRRGGELPGLWFVEALAAMGCDEAAVRQTLYRMERSGELTARRQGREKVYRPTGYAQGEITAGTGKIFEPPATWDGRWTMVWARFEKDERLHRERLQGLLQVEGFGSVGAGLYIHPRPRGERVLAAVDESVRNRLLVLRGDRLGTEPDELFIARHWDLPALARRYREVLRDLERIAGASRGRIRDVESFRRRFEVVIRFLRVAWDDPDLPEELLPSGWVGALARERAAELYERFLPGAVRYGDRVLESTGHAVVAGAQR